MPVPQIMPVRGGGAARAGVLVASMTGAWGCQCRELWHQQLQC